MTPCTAPPLLPGPPRLVLLLFYHVGGCPARAFRRSFRHTPTEGSIPGARNVLLDIAGPGCIHRVLTARVGKDVAGTRIQVFLDGSPQAVFDTPVDQFLDDKNGPLPYRLLFHKPYPGVLLHVTWPHEKEWWGEGDNPGTFVPNLFDRSNQWRWPSVDQSSHCSRRTLNP